VAFTGGGYGWNSRGARGNPENLSVLDLSPRQRLNDVVRQVSGLPFGGTDCALPMLWADANKRDFDVIEVYTDSETWAGGIHPSQALVEYRQTRGLDTKLVVYGMVSNGFSIADPNDPGMLDVVGFDTAVPNLVAAFIDGGF
jgi:60 kDa SS-A/Ro ribonucleoprotein